MKLAEIIFFALWLGVWSYNNVSYGTQNPMRQKALIEKDLEYHGVGVLIMGPEHAQFPAPADCVALPSSYEWFEAAKLPEAYLIFEYMLYAPFPAAKL